MAGSRKGAVKTAPKASNGSTPDLVFEFKKDEFTIDDFLLLDEFNQAREAARRGEKVEYPMTELLRFFDRAIVGGIGQYKMSQLLQVIEASSRAMSVIIAEVMQENNPLGRSNRG